MKLLINNIKLPINHSYSDIVQETSRYLKLPNTKIKDLSIKHKSIDARHGEVKYVYSVEAEVASGDKIYKSGKYKNVSLPNSCKYTPPKCDKDKRPIIVGAGPAGLFCAYICVLSGLRPIVIERGSKSEERQADVSAFWETGTLKPDSNVQFGEGGAGTFSDGKLNTLVKDKQGRCSFVLETFVRFGAPANILYDAKPHVGTDILINVVKNLREYINKSGGEFLFNTCVTDILTKDMRVRGVVASSIHGEQEIYSDYVVLAIGHSARDTFELLEQKNILIKPKPFAVGLRVEHPRQFIDSAQYGTGNQAYLPAASYKLTASSSSQRGVYSFCMCPGGYVVNASSEAEMLAVNGMSYSGRNGHNSNTAVIVTVTEADFPGTDNLAGVRFQRNLEKTAYLLGKGKIPVQKYGEFYKSIIGESHIDINDKYNDFYDGFVPQTKGAYNEADLTNLLPKEISRSLCEGMQIFGTKIKGYNHPDAFLSGVESRTSSPIKILRDEEGKSPSYTGLYPCGEGAGYAGGITSAAMDGIYIAERIITSND